VLWQVVLTLALWDAPLCMVFQHLGKKGGNHTIAMLKQQLTQVMEQLSCAVK
jgi:hypothetical protein